VKTCCKAFLGEQFDGDEDVMREIYAEYVSSMREKLEEIARAAEGKQWDALDKLAHAVKGNSLAVGDQEMADTAISLRGFAKLSNADGADDCIRRMRELFAEL
jgi:HPt (histidine-containing phosphotransfer) domain-containing protein